jgi:hypothetical protein
MKINKISINNKQKYNNQLNKVQQKKHKNKIKLKQFLPIKLIKLTRYKINKKIKVGG